MMKNTLFQSNGALTSAASTVVDDILSNLSSLFGIH
jgi:hypothetical protein